MVNSDINFVEVIGRKIVIHTKHCVIEGSLSEQLEYILKPYGFEELFKGKLANMSKIVSFDPKAHKVYFDHVKKNGCCVSRPNVHKVKHFKHYSIENDK